MNLDQLIEIAKLSEAGKFDAIFLADQNSVIDMENRAIFEAMTPWTRPAVFEPLTLLAALARETERIGLVATSNTTYDEPYLVARRFASLDNISGGRSGWNVVTGAYDVDALNFSLSAPPPKEDRYERAREFFDVVTGLWKSWDDDAFIQDQETGRYLDADRVHELHHEGKFFRVKGPLNSLRPKQHRPIIFHAGQSEAGRDLGAYVADIIFSVTTDKETSGDFRREMRRRAELLGRDPDMLRIMPAASFLVCDTTAEAKRIEAQLDALITPAMGMHFLSQIVHMDLSGCEADDPMPEVPADDLVGMGSFRRSVGNMAKSEGLTIRQTYQRVLPAIGNAHFSGDPVTVADQIEDWYRSGACDGFVVASPIMPYALKQTVNLLVPELQRRGLFRSEYQGDTIRDVMGLPVPTMNPVGLDLEK